MKFTFITFLIFLGMMHTCSGQVKINTTCSNGRIFVNEDGPFTITCLHAYYNIPVTWTLHYANGNSAEIGTCITSTCTTRIMIGANLTSNITASELHFLRINRSMENGVVQCSQGAGIQKTNCTLEIQYPAVLEDCFIWNNSETKSVSGYCRVPKVYSSSNRYNCRWYEHTNGRNIQQIAIGTVSLTPFKDSLGFLYYQGNCSMNKTNFSLKQNTTYSADFTPGTVFVSAVVNNFTTVPGTASSGLTTVCSTTTDIISTPSDAQVQAASSAGYLIAGIIGFVMGIAVTVIVIIFILRRKTKRTSEDGANNITTNAFQVDTASQTDVLKENEGAYSALQMADVGQRSPYEDFHMYRN